MAEQLFACQDIRYKNRAKPIEVPEEMYESGAMEVKVTLFIHESTNYRSMCT